MPATRKRRSTVRPSVVRIRYNTALLMADMTAEGWLVADLARNSGVSHATLHHLFKGKKPVSPRIVKKVATALKQDIRRYLPEPPSDAAPKAERVA